MYKTEDYLDNFSAQRGKTIQNIKVYKSEQYLKPKSKTNIKHLFILF